MAVSHTLKSAVTGVYPAFQISYPQVLISRGGLPNADAPSAVAGAAGKIVWHWTDNGFISPDGKKIANSVYTGELIV